MSFRLKMYFVWTFVIMNLFLANSEFCWAQSAHEDSKQPHIFAEGIISTGHEFTITFTPDGMIAYFTRSFPDLEITHIMKTEFRNGSWQNPKPVSFSDIRWSDLDPALSPDGKKLFFVSKRPNVKDGNVGNMDIWAVNWIQNKWGQPYRLNNVNSAAKEGSPTVSKEGTLCFFSDRNAEPNLNSIYCAKRKGPSYDKPEKLSINSDSSDTSPYLSADGNIMLFYSTRSGTGGADIFFSLKKHNSWNPPQNIGNKVNTENWEYNPSISPDGKTLYFGRNRNIYAIPVAILNISEYLN